MAYELLDKEDWTVLSEIAAEIASLIIEDMDAGRGDEERTQSFEEGALYEKFFAQIHFMETKYGPHPIILDTKADFTEDVDEQIRLKQDAIKLCLPNDHSLRGNITKDLAEIIFDEKNDVVGAKALIEAAIRDLDVDKDERDLASAKEIRDRIFEAN